MTRLSHSASEKYSTCPAMYKLHYIDKIRSDKIGSALHFGNAMDEALNVLLSTKMDTPAENATDDLDRLKAGFDHHMTFRIINKEMEDIRTSHFVEYYKSDFDRDILLPDDFKSLETFIKEAGYVIDPNEKDPMVSNTPKPLDLYDLISGFIKDKAELNSTDLSFYNYASWLSLRRKGHLMLECYKSEILPKIKRVVSIQKKVDLPNEDGDTLTGYIDFEAEFYDYEGVVTTDNKTSSRPYKVEDINDKGQLLIYDEYTLNGLGGYVVLMKKVAYRKEKTCQVCGAVTDRNIKKCAEMTDKKRCNGELTLEKFPYIKHQILIDQINERKKDLHFDKLCDILDKIENEEFPQNRDSCFQYGKPCIYYDYCRSDPTDPDITGLVKSES